MRRSNALKAAGATFPATRAGKPVRASPGISFRTGRAAKRHRSFREGAAAFSRHLTTLPGLADMVKEFYRVEWWERMRLGQFPQIVADELFEQAVNMGRSGAGRLLQRLCNAFNYDRGRPLFEDLIEDGAAGPLRALAALLDGHVSAPELVHALNGLQTAHYVHLAARNPARRKFMAGWLSRTHCPETSMQHSE